MTGDRAPLTDRAPVAGAAAPAAAEGHGPSVLQVVSTGARVGVSGVVSLLVRGLAARGYAPTVVTLTEGPLVEEVARYGVPGSVLRVDRPFDPAAVVRIRAFLAARRFDVVHTHGARAMFAGNLAARWAGTRAVVTTFHELSSVKALTSRHYKLYYRVEGALGRGWTDACVATSRAVLDDAIAVRRVPPDRITLIHNGVDTARFHRIADPAALEPIRARLGLHPGDVVIGALGSLSPVKGHAVLIDALPRLLDRVPRARVVIAGFGPLRAELEQRAARLGVGDRVVLPGDVGEANLLHNCFDVHALPSLAESTPLVVLEAIACGVPVVASAVGDVPALLDQGRGGLLVEPGDPAALADALARVLTEPGLRERIAAAAWAHASQTYSADGFADRHVALYRSLLERRATRSAVRRAGAAP